MMKKIVPSAVALLLAAGLATAQTREADHQAHHPDGAASAPVARPPAGVPADMDARMAAMQEMHRKMMAAKTPEERQALMAEHMKAMQGGMGMMRQMRADRGGGAAMPADPRTRMDAMEQRMDMMQLMMEMMMDRLPAAPARARK